MLIWLKSPGTWAAPLALVAVALGSGCTTPDIGPSKSGELSAGRFAYRCLGDSDPFCDGGGNPTSFPESMAVGGRFDLEYDPDDWPFDDQPLPRIVPASPVSVQTPGMGYAIMRPGFAAFLARDAFGEVFDLRHLYAAPVARIAVTVGGSQELDTIRIVPGESIDLVAQPQDEFRALLGGSLDYTWQSDDESVARFTSVDMDRDIALQAIADGVTTIRVTAGDHEQVITVEVGMPDPGTGTSDDAGSTGDASTGGSSGDGSTGDGSSGDGSTGGESTGGESTGGDTGTDSGGGSSSTGGN